MAGFFAAPAGTLGLNAAGALGFGPVRAFCTPPVAGFAGAFADAGLKAAGFEGAGAGFGGAVFAVVVLVVFVVIVPTCGFVGGAVILFGVDLAL